MDVSSVIDFTLKFIDFNVGQKVAKNRILLIPIKMALSRRKKQKEFAKAEWLAVVRQE